MRKREPENKTGGAPAITPVLFPDHALMIIFECLSLKRHLSLGPSSALGEKGEKIGERRPPLDSFRSPVFFLFHPVLCLFPHQQSLVPG